MTDDNLCNHCEEQPHFIAEWGVCLDCFKGESRRMMLERFRDRLPEESVEYLEQEIEDDDYDDYE